MNKILEIVVCLIVLVGPLHAQGRIPRPHPSLSGDEILRHTAERYNNARSYQDTGFVQLRASVNDGAKPRILNSFNTYFQRPGYYRFQWKANSETDNGWKVIWTTGEFFSTLDANGDRETEVNRGTTISRAAALTRGASQTVATLLIGTVHGFRLSQMTQVNLVGQGNVEGKSCYIVRGHHPLGFAIDVWIGKSDFLIRKIRQINGDGSFQEEIRQNIKLNLPIPPRTFEYKSTRTAPKNVT